MEKMRRFKQELSLEEQEKIWKRNDYGVIAMNTEVGQPYALPLNYLYENGNIYLHGAVAGYKNRFLGHGEKVSFCVVDYCATDLEKFTSQYESVIAFGTVHTVEDEAEKRDIFLKFCEKFFIGREEKWNDEIALGMRSATLWCIKVEEKTGKASMGMVK